MTKGQAEIEKIIKEEKLYLEIQEFLVDHINVVFHMFQNQSPAPPQHFWLNRKLAVLAMTNAVSDMKRSATYHSASGPSDFKVAGFTGKWIAHQRPICVDDKRPINLHSVDLEQINSDFATYFVQSLLPVKIYPKLASDLSYCFEFRRPTGDEISLLIEHALKWSPEYCATITM